jgi:predicted ester cyclase
VAVRNSTAPASRAASRAKRGLTILTECVTDDFVDHGSPIPIPPGPAGYTQILTFVHQVLRIRYEMKDLFATEDRIVVRAVASGVGVAEFHGPAAVGREYTMTTLHIYRTEGDRLAEHWGVRDELGAMRRMGALPDSTA